MNHRPEPVILQMPEGLFPLERFCAAHDAAFLRSEIRFDCFNTFPFIPFHLSVAGKTINFYATDTAGGQNQIAKIAFKAYFRGVISVQIFYIMYFLRCLALPINCLLCALTEVCLKFRPRCLTLSRGIKTVGGGFTQF
jgi:hypothetical protein